MANGGTSISHDVMDLIERRIKSAANMEEMRRQLVALNGIASDVGTDPTAHRARYLFLRGALFTKAAKSRHGGWVASSSDSLQNALVLFTDADLILKRSEIQAQWSNDLSELQRNCAYEAMVAVTTLQAWGTQPDIIPDTNCLYPEEQRLVQRHRDHNHLLRSRF